MFKSHVDALVTVASGVLVLSITLSQGNTSKPLDMGLLKITWVILAVSILFGVIYSYTLTHLASRKECWPKNTCGHRSLLQWCGILQHLSFISAMALFLIIALTYL
jgi:hypothetical protein